VEVLSIHVISEPDQDFIPKVIPHSVNRFRNLSGSKHSGGMALRFARITRGGGHPRAGQGDLRETGEETSLGVLNVKLGEG